MTDTDHLYDHLAPLVGKEIPGGCESCDAYQTVHRLGVRAWKTTVHHDDWCPVYIAMGKP